MTGSLAIMSDAVHSLSDLANNAMMYYVVDHAAKPADDGHPYGHRKFEILAVFCLATLLTVLGVELALSAFRDTDPQVTTDSWSMWLMGFVLLANIVVATWQKYWAKRLDSAILAADADHTFADVLTTCAVIAGWQLSSRGFPWLDSVVACAVALLIGTLAFKLFQSVIPALTDAVAIEPELISNAVASVPGVLGTQRIRSRWVGRTGAIDLTIFVEQDKSTKHAHHIADQVEHCLHEMFDVEDVTVHIEPLDHNENGE